jgi:hypothetical protein
VIAHNNLKFSENSPSFIEEISEKHEKTPVLCVFCNFELLSKQRRIYHQPTSIKTDIASDFWYVSLFKSVIQDD